MKRLTWNKQSHSLLTDGPSVELSERAMYLRLLVEMLPVRDPEQRVGGAEAPAVGWLITEAGVPYTTRRLARVMHCADPQAVDAAVAELLSERILVFSDAGVLGVVDWETRQCHPNTKYVQAHRARKAAQASGETHSKVEERREEEVEKEGEVEPLPSPSVTAPPEPAKRRRAKAQPVDDPMAASVLAAYHEHCKALGLVDADAPPRTSAAQQKLVQAAGVTAEVWETVLRRAAESLRRDAQAQGVHVTALTGARYFVIETLARPKNRERYLALTWLDRPATGPPSATRLRSLAPPAP